MKADSGGCVFGKQQDEAGEPSASLHHHIQQDSSSEKDVDFGGRAKQRATSPFAPNEMPRKEPSLPG